MPFPRLSTLVRFCTVSLTAFVTTALAAQSPAGTVRIAVVLDSTSDASRGAVLALEESARAASLLRRTLVVDTLRRAMPSPAAIVVRAGGAPPPRDAVSIDAWCGSPAEEHPLRFTTCGSAPADSAAWLPSLEKFGAAQLNARYLARWHRPMTADAWRGWIAAKIAWESAIRGPRAPGPLAQWLLSARARFDGHQGVPLAFGADHRLRHPLHSR